MNTLTKFSKPTQRRVFLSLLIVSIFFVTCKKTTIINNYITNPPQPMGAGLVQTPASTYSNIPTATVPPTGGASLPSSYFIEIPTTPFNQGNQGSCASVATAMAKSIVDHVKNSTPYSNNGIIYSPSYIHNQVRLNPNDCVNGGSYLYSNFDILKTQGVCKLSDMAYNVSDCNTQPSNNQRTLAANNKIDHYFRLGPINTETIKRFINIGLPVIVAFKVDNRFLNNYWDVNNANTVWSSFGTYQGSDHATLLYGWDDSKNAFKMLNQWGSQWGNNGSIWVSYSLVENLNVFYEAYILQNGAPTNTNNLQVTGDLNFGNTTINTNATKTIQLINNGATSINVSSISVTSPFSVNWNSGTIQPGATQTVTVTYNPTSVGNSSSTLTINSNAANSPNTIQASGVGVQQTTQTRIIALSGNLSFGNVTVGQSSSKTLTISNNGNSPLTVSSVQTPQGFSGNSSGTIQPNSSVTMTIFFSPTNVQSYSGNIVVNSDATSGTNSISCSGTGTSSGGGGPVAVPAIGSYGNCEPSGQSYVCSATTSYGTGVINGRIVSINTATKQIVVEIKKCNGTAFNAGGNFNVVSGLCTGVSYGFGSFNSGGTAVQMTITDNNMTGTKTYWPFIVQGTSLNILYTAPPIIVTY
jgi:C1A family cysteine protease